MENRPHDSGFSLTAIVSDLPPLTLVRAFFVVRVPRDSAPHAPRLALNDPLSPCRESVRDGAGSESTDRPNTRTTVHRPPRSSSPRALPLLAAGEPAEGNRTCRWRAVEHGSGAVAVQHQKLRMSISQESRRRHLPLANRLLFKAHEPIECIGIAASRRPSFEPKW